MDLIDQVLAHRWELVGPREMCGISGIVATPPAQQGSQLVPAVYNVPLPSGIASAAAVQLANVTTSGTFRLTLAASQTALGVGSPGATTFTPSVLFTDPSGAGVTTVVMGAFTTAATNGVVGYIALASGLGTIVFRAKAGTAISVSITVTGGGGTTNPSVQIVPILEALGQ